MGRITSMWQEIIHLIPFVDIDLIRSDIRISIVFHPTVSQPIVSDMVIATSLIRCFVQALISSPTERETNSSSDAKANVSKSRTTALARSPAWKYGVDRKKLVWNHWKTNERHVRKLVTAEKSRRETPLNLFQTWWQVRRVVQWLTHHRRVQYRGRPRSVMSSRSWFRSSRYRSPEWPI